MFGRARDPVCGAKIKKSTPFRTKWKGRKFYFDCQACKTTFEEDPERYAGKRKRNFWKKLIEAGKEVPRSCHECPVRKECQKKGE